MGLTNNKVFEKIYITLVIQHHLEICCFIQYITEVL